MEKLFVTKVETEAIDVTAGFTGDFHLVPGRTTVVLTGRNIKMEVLNWKGDLPKIRDVFLMEELRAE